MRGPLVFSAAGSWGHNARICCSHGICAAAAEGEAWRVCCTPAGHGDLGNVFTDGIIVLVVVLSRPGSNQLTAIRNAIEATAFIMTMTGGFDHCDGR